LLSVPGKDPDQDNAQDILRDRYGEILTVHRLDMETSGILLFARSIETQRYFSAQFAGKKTDKIYCALVHGQPKEDAGTIDLPLHTDWPNRPRQMVDYVNGKDAVTEWRVLERRDTYSRMALRPITGRTHQLRVHMLNIGHPILGDSLYAFGEGLAAMDRLALHAEKLTFLHPKSLESVDVYDACPF
jgi:tRNA pseudouridine32 synthase/23S rRNA pseudouridine746 synthase